MLSKIKEFFGRVRGRFSTAVNTVVESLPQDSAMAGFGMIAAAAGTILVGAVIGGITGFLGAFAGGVLLHRHGGGVLLPQRAGVPGLHSSP